MLTDIATGWTECAPRLVREQTVLITALTELRKLLPFPLLGFDTDNDSVFMNESVHEYCLRDNIELTRCRPYRKNDQAFVEQKNGAIVRKIVGYRRFEGLRATRELYIGIPRVARLGRADPHHRRISRCNFREAFGVDVAKLKNAIAVANRA